ncbi:multidrug ABC transporter permease [Chitiniphilus shinanonensis]|uniref:Multidrug ABC transporter permease n=1 Tax=Chitiniphilus shinanonensis TaxID=553088 RepID=A0ABQ6BN56_9NEIS|nr:efflux transporter outer membrane subunit [Chitiniphilus shinanonensis]GLS03353.1 multidrug ABC transporter permease [Chitiniphilus shinanonensis]
MQQRIFTLLPLVALLGACSMAPRYERPASPVPVQLSAGQANTQAALPGWQDYFADPALKALIAQALDNNRDLRIAVARIQEARALYGITNADRLPTLALGGGEQAARTPRTVTGGEATVGRRYDANLGFTAFELDFWGRVKSLSDAARSRYLATEEAQRSVRISLIAEVANAYWNLRSFDERAELARKTVQSLSESDRVIGRRLETGLANKLDALQATAAVEEARASQANLERQARNARNALQLLVGAAVAVPDTDTLLVDTLPNTRVPEGLASDVLLVRPDVRQAEYALRAANADIGAARAAFFPTITLTANAGSASAQLSDLFGSGSGAWSFMPQITLPIFDSGRNKANLDLAEARKVIAVAEYERTVQTAFREVSDVLSDQQGQQEYVEALERAVARQTERLEVAQSRYDAGLVGYLDVLDAQRSQYLSQQALIDAARARLAVTAEAFKALGGDEQKPLEE